VCVSKCNNACESFVSRKVCSGTKKGGLGIKDIRKLNLSLLAKWWWKLEQETGIWQDIINAKYIKGKPIPLITHNQNNCPVWADLLKVRSLYLQGRKVKIRNGKNNQFWKPLLSVNQ